MATLLVHWLISGSAIAAAAFVAIQFVPAGAAADRHRLWWVALLAVVAMPLLPFAASLVALDDVQALGRSTTEVRSAALFNLAPPSWLAPLLAGAWASWALVALVRLGGSVVAVKRLVATSIDMDDDALAEVAGRVRGARVRSASGLRGACAVGFARPQIIVGVELSTRIDAEALRLVVLHEAAHLARYDDWTRLGRQLIVAMAGFHPAVWFIARQIDHECESACDQWVVTETGTAMQYARALVTVAEAAPGAGHSHGVLAPGVLERRSRLRQRVARVLAGSAVPRAVRLVRATVGAGLIGCAALLTASIPPIVTLVVGPPPRVLGALPLSAKPRARVPDVNSRRPSAPDAMPPAAQASTPLPAAQAEPATRARVVPDEASDSAVPDTGATVDRSMDVLPDAPPLLQAIAVPAGNPDAVRKASNLGALASRAGIVTGAAASRAGQSVGRFFSRGGRAMSNRF